jgi:hypothetical protein
VLRVAADAHVLVPVQVPEQAADTPAAAPAHDEAEARQQAVKQLVASLREQAERPWRFSATAIDKLVSSVDLSGSDWAPFEATLR